MPSVQKYFLREVEKMGDLKKFPRKIFLTGCQVSDNGKKVDYKILTLEYNKIGECIFVPIRWSFGTLKGLKQR